MADLFAKNIRTISKHLNNIFKSKELIKEEITFNPNDSTYSGNGIIQCKHNRYYTILMQLSLLDIMLT